MWIISGLGIISGSGSFRGLYRPPELVNFRLKSLLETTFAQIKQICSFDDGDTHTRSIDLVGLESAAHSAIKVKDSQMKPETPNASHATPHFWREMQMKTHLRRSLRSPRGRLVASLTGCGLLFLRLENNGTMVVTFSLAWLKSAICVLLSPHKGWLCARCDTTYFKILRQLEIR